MIPQPFSSQDSSSTSSTTVERRNKSKKKKKNKKVRNRIEIPVNDKRRSFNWLPLELECLEREVVKYKPILYPTVTRGLDGKKTSIGNQTFYTRVKQNEVWDRIAHEVNKVMKGAHKRRGSDCRKRHQRAKSDVKKKDVRIRQHRAQTGGGPGPTETLTELEELTLAQLNPLQVHGLDRGIDTSSCTLTVDPKNQNSLFALGGYFQTSGPRATHPSSTVVSGAYKNLIFAESLDVTSNKDPQPSHANSILFEANEVSHVVTCMETEPTIATSLHCSEFVAANSSLETQESCEDRYIAETCEIELEPLEVCSTVFRDDSNTCDVSMPQAFDLHYGNSKEQQTQTEFNEQETQTEPLHVTSGMVFCQNTKILNAMLEKTELVKMQNFLLGSIAKNLKVISDNFTGQKDK